MKKLLVLTVLGLMLSGMAGCRFMDCLWRGGPPAQQPCQQSGTVVVPNACPPDPCGGGTTVTTPGPTYAPGMGRN
jgi:hypothetical protein